MRLLFIHHSCGGQLMAEQGDKVGGASGSGERCIYVSHPNGGGLRSLLTTAGYEVHEASYESKLGQDTDISDWLPKFSTQMNLVLTCDKQDAFYDDGRTNQIVAFKSCYPNNDFVGVGSEPGDPSMPEWTIANAKAAYNSLLPHFKDNPEVLFVAFTAPPRAEKKLSGWDKIKALFDKKPTQADFARDFNNWMVDSWLANYEFPNVVVFDHYNILTNDGKTNWSAYPTGGGKDSHPSAIGNTKAAKAFIPFLDDAVKKMQD